MSNPLAALAAPPRPRLDVGVHVGQVTRIAGGKAWVEIPSLVPGYEYGPCRVPADWRDWTHVGHGALAPDAEPEHRPNLTAGTTVTVLLSPVGHHLLARY